MSEKKEEVLNQILSETLEAVKKVKHLGEENAPEMAREVIREAKYKNFAALGLGFVFAVISFSVFLVKPMIDTHREDITGWCALSFGFGAVAFVIGMTTLFSLITLYAAPRTYVLRTLAAAIKGRG